MNAARQLPIALRDPFRQAVANALFVHAVVGPGTVHQVVREQQKRILRSAAGVLAKGLGFFRLARTRGIVLLRAALGVAGFVFCDL
jgi:hypothetical protein